MRQRYLDREISAEENKDDNAIVINRIGWN